MIENEFVVPDRTEDLCKIHEDQYVVYDIISVRDISAEIKTFKELLLEDGDEFIFKRFDTYYSLLRQFSETEENVRFEAYEILLEVSQELNNKLKVVLGDNEELSNPETRFKYRNLIKMSAYLLCQLAEAYETELLKPSIVVTEMKKGRKKKKTVFESGWDTIRADFITRLSELYKLPINKLWEPPIIEHEFVNIVTLSFFKLLENPDVVQNQELCDDTFDFLGYSLKAHNTNLGYSIKIIQLVQDHQHLPTCLSKMIHLFVKEYGKQSIIVEIFREMRCLDSDDLIRDTARTHHLADFLIGVAEKCTNEVMNVINVLLPNLEEESHILRNCVISIIGEIVSKISASGDLSKEVSDLRDTLISTLLDHMLDLNAFVRCKVLQVVKRLMDEGAMPLSMQLQFLESAIQRLKDKTCIVRKNALQFLKTFLMTNPFAAKLPIEELRKNYEDEEKKLKETYPDVKLSPAIHFNDSDDDNEKPLKHDDVGNEETGDHNNDEAKGDRAEINEDGEVVKTDQDGDVDAPMVDKAVDEEVDSNMETAETSSKNDSSPVKQCQLPSESDIAAKISEDEKVKQLILVEYLKLTLKSAKAVVSSMPLVCEVLKSTAITDVLEAIEYVTTAFEFGLREAVSGIKEMMRLIFSKEPSVKNAVIASYRKLYLTTKEEDKDVAATLISKNLILFLHGATENEVFAIEEFIKEFINTGDITNLVLEKLWETFAMESENTTREESLSSLLLLSMAASKNPDIILRRLDFITHIGLGERAKNDFQLVRETCRALLKLNVSHQHGLELKMKIPQSRLPVNHTLFISLSALLVTGSTNEEDDGWCPMAESAVALIFKLADQPERICKLVVNEMLQKIHKSRKDSEKEGEDKKKEDEEEVGEEEKGTYNKKLVFIRFLFFCGHAVLCYVMYLENDVLMELKRREQMRNQIESAENKNPFKKHKDIRPVIAKGNNKSDSGSEDHKPEAEDRMLEFISRICNEEILSSKHFFGILYNAVLFTCRFARKEFDSQIFAAASLSLTKFMTVSARTCENNMQLLVTILEKCPDPDIRSNLIIAMGDLLARFPNQVHPWTPNFYKSLKDESPVVRLNTLVVLTHLILRDMIKVKGQISDIALCMIDEEDEAVSVVKYLFKELSKKKNKLYNLLPDLISGLSDTNSDVSEQHFQIIIKYVFQYIGKEKEVEGLVEKLCARLKDTCTPSQLHKIIFSLTLFTMTEKCFRKIMEHKDCFKGKSEDEIFVCYMKEIIANGKKNNVQLEQEIDTFTNELSIH